ncbi:MAG: hypothetical protein ACI837_002316 [Crocinitomicaceae bacterium]|jgi:hypothetical protein
MSTEKPITLRSFASEEEAQDLVNLLKERGLHTEVLKDSGGNLDKSFEGETMLQGFEVQILASDKEAAEEVLTNMALELMAAIPKDYYLFEFSDDELIDVLVKHNEWGEFDVALSQKILMDRGITFSREEMTEKRVARITELSIPEGGQNGWIVVGYIFAVVGGFFGLLIGYILWKTMRKIPDGTKVPNYNDSIRAHGKIIFFISLVIFPIVLILKLSGQISPFGL